MSRKRKPIPVFKSEAEERTFWESHNSTAYVDWNEAEPVRFVNLKPSLRQLGDRSDKGPGHGRPPLPNPLPPGERRGKRKNRRVPSAHFGLPCAAFVLCGGQVAD